jgi:hypothetical protein
MKQFQRGQLHVGQLLSDLSLRLARSQGEVSKSRLCSDKAATKGTRLLCSTSSTRTPEEILKATERRWPSRYY